MSLRVLIVDDSPLARSVVARAFQQHQCEVVGLAANGNEALELYRKLTPDLVTLDLVMPQMDGLECLRALKEFDPAAVVIVVSSLGKTKAIVDCVKAGAAHFLVKPFKPEAVGQSLLKCFPERFDQDPDTGRTIPRQVPLPRNSAR